MPSARNATSQIVAALKMAGFKPLVNIDNMTLDSDAEHEVTLDIEIEGTIFNVIITTFHMGPKQ